MELVNKETLEKLKDDGKLVISFFMEKCKRCIAFSPLLEEISDEYIGIRFIKINIENEKELIQEYSVNSVPTVLMLENGRVKNRVTQLLDKRSLKLEMNKAYK